MKKIAILSLLLTISVLIATAQQDSSHISPLSKVRNDSLLTRKDSSFTKIDSLIHEVLIYAKSFLGSPYRYAGKSKAGFDCSGFVSTVYAKFGVRLDPSSYGMEGSGRSIPREQIKPGDILFFVNTQRRRRGVGHVGLAYEVKNGDVIFIHSAVNGGVRFDYLSSKYYNAHYYKAERIPLIDNRDQAKRN